MIGSIIRLFSNPKKSKNRLYDLIINRRSCREFKKRDISRNILKKIVDAGRLAPSSVNLQTWSFIIFDNKDWKRVFNRNIPFGANKAVIVCADFNRVSNLIDDFKKNRMLLYSISVFNAGLAAQNMTIAAETLNLKSVMLSDTGRSGLFDFDYLIEKLELPENVYPITTVAFGYPKSNLNFGIPPKFKFNEIADYAKYPKISKNALLEWFSSMEIGYSIANKFAKFKDKLKYYKSKSDLAEKKLRKSILENEKL